MSADELDTRLTMIEHLIATADPKDLPYLNQTYQRLLDRLVALDMAGKTREEEPCRRCQR